jgi:hypothetical protein
MKKIKKKRKLKKGKIAFIIITAVIVITILYLMQPKESTTNLQEIEIQHLSEQEKNKVIQTITSTEFVEDIPKNNPIVLRFYKYENGETVWQDSFLIHSNFPYEPPSNKEPSIYIFLHSRYIEEINNDNLCEVIQKAKNNGEISFQSKHKNAVLLIKYAKLIKYKECLGL